MSFSSTLKWSLFLSFSLLVLIYFLTNKSIKPYSYELKYVENQDVLINLIQSDSIFNVRLVACSEAQKMFYSIALEKSTKYCNAQRKIILKDYYYSVRDKAKLSHIALNDYINAICIDSLKNNLDEVCSN